MPDDVVGVVVDDRHARDALVEEDRHRLARRGRGIHRHHVGARHHHRAHERVGEVEDRVDELAVVLLDELVLGGLVDDARAAAPRTRTTSRATTPGVTRLPSATRPCASGPRRMRTPRMTGAAPRSRPFACCRPTLRGLAPTTTNEIAGHEHRGGEHRPPDAVEEQRERDRDEHGGRRLGEDADEDDRVGVRLGVVGDPAQRRRRCVPPAPSSARSAREVTPSAASIAAIRPPNATSSTAASEQQGSGHARLSSTLGGLEPHDELAAAGRTSRAPPRARRGRSRGGAAGRAW